MRLSIYLDPRFKFSVCVFFFFLACMNNNPYCSCTWIHYAGDKIYCSCTVHRNHDTIHAFKNYFATMFLVFSFQQNKLYPNGP